MKITSGGIETKTLNAGCIKGMLLNMKSGEPLKFNMT